LKNAVKRGETEIQRAKDDASGNGREDARIDREGMVGLLGMGRGDKEEELGMIVI
jgi:hypothetical protein